MVIEGAPRTHVNQNFRVSGILNGELRVPGAPAGARGTTRGMCLFADPFLFRVRLFVVGGATNSTLTGPAAPHRRSAAGT